MQRRLPIWDEAPKRAIDAVTTVLQQAQLRREIEINDPSAAARQFVAMLRGDLHLEILFGLRGCPGATETNIRVKSAVDLLLCGSRATGSVARELLAYPNRRGRLGTYCGSAATLSVARAVAHWVSRPNNEHSFDLPAEWFECVQRNDRSAS